MCKAVFNYVDNVMTRLVSFANREGISCEVLFEDPRSGKSFEQQVIRARIVAIEPSRDLTGGFRRVVPERSLIFTAPAELASEKPSELVPISDAALVLFAFFMHGEPRREVFYEAVADSFRAERAKAAT